MGLETIVVLLSVALSEEVDVDAIKVTWYVSPFSLSPGNSFSTVLWRACTRVYIRVRVGVCGASMGLKRP